MFTFLLWFYSIHFINISNFVSNLIFYILKYFQFHDLNSICSSLMMNIAFLGKQPTCFSADIIMDSCIWPYRKRTGHGSLTLLELWSWPEDMMGVTLQWTVFIENANKPEFASWQRTVMYGISSLLEMTQSIR